MIRRSMGGVACPTPGCTKMVVLTTLKPDHVLEAKMRSEAEREERRRHREEEEEGENGGGDYEMMDIDEGK
jgi:E3 SUMO-protein ligase NSE2